jgi:hypothetical protein
MDIPEVILAVISLELILRQVTSSDVWWTAWGFEGGKGWEDRGGSASLKIGRIDRANGALDPSGIGSAVSGVNRWCC